MALELRYYQREAIDAIYAWFERERGNPLVVIPTGAGKSLIIAGFAQETLSAWSDTRILVITDSKELVLQDYQEMIDLWPDAPVGIYSAGLRKRNLHQQITFASIQSIYGRAYKLQKVDLIIVDEAHMISRKESSMYAKLFADLLQINPHLKIIGLTATPYRLDSGMLHEGDDALFAGIAYEAPIADLIAKGYLSPVTSVRSNAQINLTGVGRRGGEFIPGQLERAAMDPNTIDQVVDEIVAASPGRRGCLIYGTGVQHCLMLRDAMKARGFDVEAVFGETPSHERDSIINRYKRGEIWGLVSKQVLTKGFNAKHVDLIAMVFATASANLYVQVVGRGTRLFPGKENCLVLDFGENIARHGPLDRLRIKTPTKTEAEMPRKVCADRMIGGQSILGCQAENEIAARICVDCGQPFAFDAKISTVASDAALLASAIRSEWVDVDDVSYRVHHKPGKPPSLLVLYRCGFLQHKEWICLEHPGYPRQKAIHWWKQRAPDQPVPGTVAEALACASTLAQPTQILVRPNGKHTEICGAKLAS